jgi:conjugal transfer pilus assembly protein TraB
MSRSSNIKRTQWIKFGAFALLFGGIAVLGGVLFSGGTRSPQSAGQKDNAKVKTVNIMAPGQTLTEKEGWRGQEGARIGEMAKVQAEMEKRLKQIEEEKIKSAAAAAVVKVTPAGQVAVVAAPAQEPRLGPGTATGTPGVAQAGVVGAPKPGGPGNPAQTMGKPVSAYPPGTPNGQMNVGVQPMMVAPVSRLVHVEMDEGSDEPVKPNATGGAIRKTGFNKVEANVGVTGDADDTTGAEKSDDGAAKDRKDIENYLPSSTFVEGELLGGLDAPTGGQSQNNPVPFIVRLTGNAYLPSKMRSEVKECMVGGAGYGDYSSERGYLRTETLSCIKRDGSAIDIPLKGYIAGEDGKAGVRGRLVTKQGQILTNAITAGVLSGVGSLLQFNASTAVPGALGGVAQVPNPGEAAQAGFGSGFNKSMDKLAQYYINLADKTFPVIEIDAGRKVTVVITKGTFIDNRTGTANK